jgi:tetratricopeptide (TPR) repeat protein
MEYRIIVFAANYKYLKDAYKKDIDIQIENIFSYFRTEMEKMNVTAESSDHRSVVFKSGNCDFKTVFETSKGCKNLISRLKSLIVDFESEIFIRTGIITSEEMDKRHPFRWNFSRDEIINAPEILVSDKAALSIMESYDIEPAGIKNIWTTDGVEIGRSERIRKIYIGRDEENEIDRFITGDQENRLLFIYGEKGSGKSAVVREVAFRNVEQTIFFLKERKQSTREFKTVHDIMFNALFFDKAGRTLSQEDVAENITSSNLPQLRKDNLRYLLNNIIMEGSQEDRIKFEYGCYISNLKTALSDALKISDIKFTVIIDDHQWMSKKCEEIILGMLKSDHNRIKIILISDDKNNLRDTSYPVKFLKISDINKVQISKLLQLAFPGMKTSVKTADFIHRATGGNIYTVKEFINYLTDKNLLGPDEKMELKLADVSLMPDNLSDMFTQKINSLSNNALSLLKIISVIGEQFFLSDLEWLLHTINYPHDENIALKELEDNGIIENAGDYFAIAEPSVTAEIYKTVLDANRKLIHGLLAELFETKGYEKYGFKVFFHYLRSENYTKLFSILPELTQYSISDLHFNALRNMIEISDKILFKMCMKSDSFPPAMWVENLKNSKWLFDPEDPVEIIKLFEKAIEFLEKSGKPELSADMYGMLLKFYLESGKTKKSGQYYTQGLAAAETLNRPDLTFRLMTLECALKIKSELFAEASDIFDRMNEIKDIDPVQYEDDDYLMVKAVVLKKRNENSAALDILNPLLKKHTESIDFAKVNTSIKLLSELSLSERDYKAAEAYCKHIISIEKDTANLTTAYKAGVTLAKIYSYQNKFLQAVSLLESIAAEAEDAELKFDASYTLGSIYQFYGETEMALKTFNETFEKLKDKKIRKLPYLKIKLSAISIRSGNFAEALNYIEDCKEIKSPVFKVMKNAALLEENSYSDELTSQILADVKSGIESEERDLVFEAGFLLLSLLGKKRKQTACTELASVLGGIAGKIEDYNLVLEYQKELRSGIKSPAKKRKKSPESRKVSPSVNKRMKNRRSI